MAAEWLGRGIQPVPLQPKSKRPAGEGGERGATAWQKMRVEEETLPQFFHAGQNVGGLWGEPSGWIVDVDLDCDEAVAVAPYFLPKTLVYGRETRPASHYLLRSIGAVTRKFSTKEHGMLVELRSTGSQTVLPGSIHPEGDRFEIFQDRLPSAIARTDLEDRVRKIASAAILAARFPDEGSRHDYIHACAGTLLHSGWKNEDITNFMEAVLEAAGSRGVARTKHDYTVKNTIENYREGHKVYGWPSLSSYIPSTERFQVHEWLKASKLEDVPPDEPAAQEADEYKFPDNLTQIPGLVGDIAEWAGRRSYRQQPLFDIAIGLLSVAIASGNRYVIGHKWDTPLQPYMFLLAPTSGGKDHIRTCLHDVAKKLGLQDNVFSAFQSYHALMDVLAKPPNTVVWLWDEAAMDLHSATGSKASQDFRILRYLLSFYGKANSSVGGLPGRKAAIPSIDYPYFLVAALAQPTQLLQALSSTEISYGLINRFILLDSGNRIPRRHIERENLFPSELEHRLKDLHAVKLSKRTNGIRPFIQVKFESREVHQEFEDFLDICEAKSGEAIGKGWEMWGRAHQNALICAGLAAVGINGHYPVITEEIAKWAIQFIQWCTERWEVRIKQSSSRTITERDSKEIEFILRQMQAYASQCRTPSESRILATGVMPRTLLLRQIRHIKWRDVEDVLQHLINSDVIGKGEREGMTVYWQKMPENKDEDSEEPAANGEDKPRRIKKLN